MIDTFFNLGIIAQAWPILLTGFGATLVLTAITVPLGCLSGLLLAAGSTIRHPLVRWPLMAWVDFFRALPPLVLLIFLYAGLPFAGVRIGAYGCVALGFFLNTGAYYGEILRAVVLPQAIRMTVPPLTNRTIAITKGTALGSVIGLAEILSQATAGESLSFNPSPLTLGAAAYLLLFLPVVALGRWIETRFAWKR